MQKNRISSATNILPSTYELLKKKGYEVTLKNGFWTAEQNNIILTSEDLISLGGLAYLYETKGTNWKLPDDVIENFIEQFGE